ncbi:MAG: VOC family protein [Thermomicrobiales bacterium]|nr:VOC family protein [Thermomicrobiales bacterium]
MPTPIKGLGEIALQVNDMDAMVDYYQRVIGLELLRRFPNNGPTFFRVADGVGGHTQVLALFDRGARPDKTHKRPPPLDHIAFGINLADFAAEKSRLEALGIPVREATHGWVQWRSLYVDDPEGNEVEWVCYDPSVEKTE